MPGHPRLRGGARGWALIATALVLLLTLGWPLYELASTSFGPTRTLDAYRRALEPGSPYASVFRGTLETALLSTLVTAVVGLPVAHLIAAAVGWRRYVLLSALVIPFFTGILVKNFVWTILLQDNGVVNDTLQTLGVIDSPVRLLFTRYAVVIGMVHYLLPLFVLPVFASLIKLDRSLLLASRSLGASRARTYVAITVPLTLPALVTGLIICFVVSLGFFVTPAMLGGRGNLMIANVIDVAVRRLGDFQFGAALAIIVAIPVLASLPSLLRLVRPATAANTSRAAKVKK